ncbi:hypothetical protein CA830_31960, partial [Burkholderia multivorans]
AVADLDAIDAADIRSQVDTADAAGTKEGLRWNTLDRYDVSGPPRWCSRLHRRVRERMPTRPWRRSRPPRSM